MEAALVLELTNLVHTPLHVVSLWSVLLRYMWIFTSLRHLLGGPPLRSGTGIEASRLHSGSVFRPSLGKCFVRPVCFRAAG